MRLEVNTHGPEEVLRRVTITVDGGEPITLSEWLSTVEYRLTQLGWDLPKARKTLAAGPFEKAENS